MSLKPPFSIIVITCAVCVAEIVLGLRVGLPFPLPPETAAGDVEVDADTDMLIAEGR